MAVLQCVMTVYRKSREPYSPSFDHRGSGDFAGEADGGDHGGRVGEVFPGDGKGGAVVGTDARFRQTEGHVHGSLEVEQLEGDEALVVIHGEDGMVVTLGGVTKNGVGHGRAAEGSESGGV